MTDKMKQLKNLLEKGKWESGQIMYWVQEIVDNALQAEQEELSLCSTCNCMTKRVCGKCKQDDITKAVHVERGKISKVWESLSHTGRSYINPVNLINPPSKE